MKCSSDNSEPRRMQSSHTKYNKLPGIIQFMHMTNTNFDHRSFNIKITDRRICHSNSIKNEITRNRNSRRVSQYILPSCFTYICPAKSFLFRCHRELSPSVKQEQTIRRRGEFSNCDPLKFNCPNNHRRWKRVSIVDRNTKTSVELAERTGLQAYGNFQQSPVSTAARRSRRSSVCAFCFTSSHVAQPRIRQRKHEQRVPVHCCKGATRGRETYDRDRRKKRRNL